MFPTGWHLDEISVGGFVSFESGLRTHSGIVTRKMMYVDAVELDGLDIVYADSSMMTYHEWRKERV